MKPVDFYRRTHDRMEAWKDQAFRDGFAPSKVLIEAALPHLRVGGRILDIGCQGGHQLLLLLPYYDEAYGIDIAHYGELWERVTGARFVTHDVDSGLPFDSDYFDCVICTHVLEHVFDVFGLAHEMCRVLKRGGSCLVSVPNVSFFKHILSLVRGKVPRTGADQVPFTEKDGWDGQHLHYFTHWELSWLLERVGLRLQITLYVGRLAWLKRLCPRFLCPSVDVVATKP